MKTGWQCEDLAKALLENDGWRVHQAKPSRRRVQKGHRVEYDQQFDVFGAWDLVCLKPEQPVLFVQVTMQRENVSEKMSEIAEQEWPLDSGRFQFWKYDTGEQEFTRFGLVEDSVDGGNKWNLLGVLRLNDPKRTLQRADTSLD